MRENRLSGSEGGGTELKSVLPTPIVENLRFVIGEGDRE